jgi:hypothetical protein
MQTIRTIHLGGGPFAAAAIALVPTGLVAHHSAAVYDMQSVVALRGPVTRYEWKNPHVYFFLTAENESGETVEWAIEGESTALMTRSGWSATTLAPGDRVFVRANINRRPERHEARLITLTKEDGEVLVRKASGTPPEVPATGLAGVWDAIRGYDDFVFVRGELTDRGSAAVNVFDEGQSPVQNCLAFTAPMVTFLPYRSKIAVEDDSIRINSEYFDVERVVYMDGRGHPESGERTHQGHSIGRWDGDALVVDTTLFADHPLGNFRGLPSGAQKHLVERFEPTPDRTQLRVTFRVEDPEFLVDPWVGEVVWDYVPDGETLPYRCDPEIARRFAIE